MANGGALNMSAGNAARPVGLNNPNTLTNGGSFGAPAVMPQQQMPGLVGGGTGAGQTAVQNNPQTGPPNFTGGFGPNFIPFNPNLSTEMPGSGLGNNTDARFRPTFGLAPKNPTQSPAQEAARGVLDQAVGNAPVDLANDFNGDGRVTSADALAKLKADTAAAAAPSGGESPLPVAYRGSEELANRFNEKNPNTADRRPSMPTKFTMPTQPPPTQIGDPAALPDDAPIKIFPGGSQRFAEEVYGIKRDYRPVPPPPSGSPLQLAAEYAAQNFTQAPSTQTGQSPSATVSMPVPTQPPPTQIGDPPQQPVQTTPPSSSATEQMMGIPLMPPGTEQISSQGDSMTPNPVESTDASTGQNNQNATARAPNINQTAATGINNAIAGATKEMGYRPMGVNASGYNARNAFGQGYSAAGTSGEGYRAAGATGRGYQAAGSEGQGYNAAQAGSQGFNAAGVDSQGYNSTNSASQGYNAQNVQAGQIANTDLAAYMNPFEDQVVQSSLSDLNRARQMQQAQAGAQAGAAGAFGGSRQALLEAENNRNYLDQASRTASGLRQAGFQNAQNLGLSDIQTMMQANLANQGAQNQSAQFGAASGNQTSLANQAASNRASEFGASAANQAAQQAAQQQQQAAMFQAQASNQAQLANQNALNQAAQFGAQAQNTSGLANQSALNQAGQFGAQALNTADLANQNALNQAGQFGASARNTAGLANQAALNQAGQFGAQARNTANLSNQNATNNARQFNANQMMNAQMANQNAALQASQQRLSAGNQLGNLSNLGFGMGQTVNQNLAQDGAMKQGINQLLIDAIKQQYAGYTGSPQQSLGLLSQALGVAPVPTSETTSKTPGLFDYLTLGASMMRPKGQ